MIGLFVSAIAGVGIYLVMTATASTGSERRGRGGPWSRVAAVGRRWMERHGLDQLRPRDLSVLCALLFLLGAVPARVLFGGWLAPAVVGVAVDAVLIGVLDQRRQARHEAANEAWPRVIEELRLLTGSLGRSLPQALFEASSSAPDELRPAFDAARREWLLSTDFARTVGVLKERLADATADAVCETLLIAHELGGSDVDRRLADLATDRREDLRLRRDARARQAGVRFARRFVLIVPLGMAFVGQSLGDGRGAYASTSGQVAVVAAIAMVAACWLWAGMLLRLPRFDRVFATS